MSSVRPSLPCTGADVLQRIFPGSSEMAKRMRSFDWSKTVLGVPEAWPQNLKISLRIMLSARTSEETRIESMHAVDESNLIQRALDTTPEPAYFTWSLFRIRLPGDAGWGILNTAWETTERKNTEEALRQAVERYEQQVRLFEGITSTTPDFVYLFDPKGRFVYANRRLLEVWGMALADVIGKTCLELG